METIEKYISPLVPGLFPSVYRDYGPQFVLFVKKYYEWLESDDQALYHMRRYFEYKDVDETTEELLVHFKEKYLKGIQLDTAHNTRLLIKHSLDLYRSKGTERSIELLFRIVYGEDASIYYPRSDLFKLSNGKFTIPKYLEVIPNQNNIKFSGKQITGRFSKATAFVEAVVRKKFGSRIIDVFYISNIKGSFVIGEPLYNASVEGFNAKIQGSLGSFNIDVDGIGENFVIGDIVKVVSNTGQGGYGRVTNTVTTVGTINFSLIEGGYGYTANAKILLSDKILKVDGFSNSVLEFETISQPLANLHYVNSNGVFESNTTIYSYYANNLVKGSAHVINANPINASAGYLFVAILSGNVNDNAVYSTANSIGANLSIIDGYTDKTATGNIIYIANSTSIGVMNVNNMFVANYSFVTSNTNSTGNVVSISGGSGAQMAISNSLLYSETLRLNDDLLATYLSVKLNATAYGFPHSPSANIASPLEVALHYGNVVFGKIQSVITLSGGSDYNVVPYVTILEPLSYGYNNKNLTLNITGSPRNYQVGEIVIQQSSNARGYVLTSNSSVLTIQNMRIMPEQIFVTTANVDSQLVGFDSGITANITAIDVIINSVPAGLNANIGLALSVSNGAINALEVYDSGFGYVDNEEVTIYDSDESEIAQSTINLTAVGKGRGFYQTKGGFLSDQKKLFDGHYWQEFSYDIISPLQTDKYKDLLKNTVHPAGFALFGTVEHIGGANLLSNSIISYVTQE